MTGSGIALFLVGSIVLLAGLGQSAQNKVFENAQYVTGIVIDKRKRDLKNGTAYELTVTYVADGNEYSKVIGITLTEYRNISEGDSFELKYLPDRPYKAIDPKALDTKKRVRCWS